MTNMQRLTAILLLLFALAGMFVPVTVAASAAPPHTCCIRHTHHCHDSAVSSSDLTIRGHGCCNHDCCRAATTSQRAHPRPSLTVTFTQRVHAAIADSHPTISVVEPSASQSQRAPPVTFA